MSWLFVIQVLIWYVGGWVVAKVILDVVVTIFGKLFSLTRKLINDRK